MKILLSDVIKKVVKKMPYKQSVDAAVVLNCWQEDIKDILGEGLFSDAEAIKYYKGYLWVRVPHSVVAAEVQMREMQVISVIKKALKNTNLEIKGLRFKIGPKEAMRD